MSESSANIVFAGNDASDDLSILDVLDHVLNAGVVIRGTVIISLAGVDLIYLGLDVILTSVETALRHMQQAQGAALPKPGTAV
ncbi:MAG TPA: gas vesicle protein [Terriglobales bacterium]|nr:gas vesicle protein [Terriglobales bacterium]